MGHAISDERARKAVERLRNIAAPNSETHVLMMYVAERLPAETKKARWVQHYVNYGSPGTRNRTEPVYEDELPEYIHALLQDGVVNIDIGPSYDKEIK